MTHSSKHVTINGIRSHYMDWEGKGDPLLLIHGDMRTSRSFDAVARRLSLTHRVLALDLYGHGDSDWPEKGYRFSDRAANINQFIEHLELRAVTAAAHSTGAVGLILSATQKPDRFQKLVLMEPMLVIDENFQKMVSSRNKRPRTTWSNKKELKKLLLEHEVTREWAKEVVKDVLDHETFTDDRGRIDMKWSSNTLNWLERENDYLNLISILEKSLCETLFIASSSREKIFQEAKKLSDKLSSLSYCVVRNTGHNMYMERPDTISELISMFSKEYPVPEEI